MFLKMYKSDFIFNVELILDDDWSVRSERFQVLVPRST
jgi:hypothetical protein